MLRDGSSLTCALLQAVRTSGDARINQHCRPWVEKLLLCTRSLAALAIPAGALPCSPIIPHLPLRHLELVVSAIPQDNPEQLFIDISRCHTLEVLRVTGDEREVIHESKRLPSMHLQSMPSLKHVRLEDCLPVDVLSLPADCSLFLEVSCASDLDWVEHLSKFKAHATVLRLSTASYSGWVLGIQSFSNLQALELHLQGRWRLDPEDLGHIPHIKLVLADETDLWMTAGSWHTLEVIYVGELGLMISDVYTFVRDTRSFTFISKNGRDEFPSSLRQEVMIACRKLGKACYVCTHYGNETWCYQLPTYVTLSTSKEVAQRCPVHLDQDDDEDPIVATAPLSSLQHIIGKTLVDLEDFWPPNPWDPVKRTSELDVTS